MQLLFDRAIYQEALMPGFELARRQIKIATANIKDLWVEGESGFEPLVHLLSRKVEAGVRVQILHSGQSTIRFVERLRSLDAATEPEVRSCLRNHMKLMLVDGFQAYVGSANFTGAGAGAKAENRRNFEIGFLLRDLSIVRELERQFDRIWNGDQQRCR